MKLGGDVHPLLFSRFNDGVGYLEFMLIPVRDIPDNDHGADLIGVGVEEWTATRFHIT